MADPLKIKVCGMKDLSNLEQVCNLEPDFVGYIFFKGSKRYVGAQPDPALFSIPGNRAARVGVFVNEPVQSVRSILDAGWLDMVQLHGTETPEYCKALVNEGIHVIKALKPGIIDRDDLLKAYYGVVHYFLFDSAGEGHGGTGMKFDWTKLKDFSLPVPYLLSGGIGPTDVTAIRSLDHMWLHGVDVNSRFEISPGEKHIAQLESFIKEIRK